jgi:hypothetical protein
MAEDEYIADEFEVLREIYGGENFVVEVLAPEEGWWCKMVLKPTLKCELRFNLPLGYPTDALLCATKVSLLALPKAAALTAAVNSALQLYCRELEMGEASIYLVTSWVEDWLNDNEEALVAAAAAAKAGGGTSSSVGSGGQGGAPLLQRQWIWFIGFYTKSIIKAFVSTAGDLGCTGFLMPGKPAVACVEGTAEAIATFIKVTRTELFAVVDRASRKMTLSLLDDTIPSRVFTSFTELQLMVSGVCVCAVCACVVCVRVRVRVRGVVAVVGSFCSRGVMKECT